MNRTFVRNALWVVVCVGCLCVAPTVFAEPSVSWQPSPEGAVEMFRQGDRLFAVGAQSGGAGVDLQPDGGENLPPRPGGEVYENSRCAMASGGCGGTCIANVGYYCSTSVCDSFNFCP